MRIPPLRLALSFSLPLLAAGPALANPYYDDYQPPAAIALFSATGFAGEVREAFDPFATLHDIAFNDRARSVAVLAGQWELCEHINFTGRCVFIREDVADLGWFGLNNAVTSIRPIFEYTEALHGLMFTRDDYGYIRYAHNASYGYNTWNYGYSSTVHVSVRHYGFSSDYLRFGYYDPRWGYDPYGFAWSYGGPRYVSYVYRVHPRPIVINNYWRTNWHNRHPKWDRRSHRDDWRRPHNWRDDGRRSDYGRGHGGSQGRGGDDRGRRGDDDRSRGGYAGRGDWRDGRPDGRGPGAGRGDSGRSDAGRTESGRTDPGRPRGGDDRGQRTGTRSFEAAPPAGGARQIADQTGSRGGVSGERPRGNFEGRPDRGTRPDAGAPTGRWGEGPRSGEFTRREAGALPSGRSSLGSAPTPGAGSAPPPTRSFDSGRGGQGDRSGRPARPQTDGLMGGPSGGSGRPDGARMRGDGGGSRGDGMRSGGRAAPPPAMPSTVSAPPPSRQSAPPAGRSGGWDGGNRSGASGGGGRSQSASPPPPAPAAVSRPAPPPRMDTGGSRRGGDGGSGRESGSRSRD
ncbi:beta/gamma crystallin-related protein [Hyphomonas sp.]|uniref:beta/gamma crystallin-related protein n=1 Tax=Hyphomonas sp. TaxID=87 RepID=UPI0039199C47